MYYSHEHSRSQQKQKQSLTTSWTPHMSCKWKDGPGIWCHSAEFGWGRQRRNSVKGKELCSTVCQADHGHNFVGLLAWKLSRWTGVMLSKNNCDNDCNHSGDEFTKSLYWETPVEGLGWRAEAKLKDINTPLSCFATKCYIHSTSNRFPHFFFQWLHKSLILRASWLPAFVLRYMSSNMSYALQVTSKMDTVVSLTRLSAHYLNNSLTVATKQGWCLCHSSLLEVQLLFEGNH